MTKSLIQLKKISITNFGPFYGTHEFEFDSDGGFHRIIGENLDYTRDVGASEAEDESQVKISNGAAKSFFTKSIGFALFGKVPNGEKINLDSLVNKQKGSDLHVSLEFNIANESSYDSYVIDRYHKHKIGKGKVVLRKLEGDEWKEVSLAEKKLTQEMIDSLLMMNFETFSKTSVLTRDGAKNFIELKSYERGKVIESIARSDKFFKYTTKIKTNLRELRKESEYERVEHAKLTSSIDTLKSQIKKEISSKKKKKKEIIAVINGVKEYIDEINEWNLQESDYEKINKLLDHLSEKRDRTFVLLNKKKDFEVATDSYRSGLKRLNELTDRIDELKQKLTDLELSDGIKCESCGEMANKTEHRRHIETVQDKLATAADERHELKKQTSKLNDSAELAGSKFEEAKKEMIQFLDVSFGLKEEVDEFVRAEYKTGSRTISIIDEIKEHQEILRKLNDDLIRNSDISSIKETISDIKAKKTEAFIKQEILDTLKKRISMNEWFDARLDFRNDNSIKQHIFAKLVPVFNTTLQAYLNIAYEGKMQVSFDSSFNESITYNDLPYDYYELSTGEKAKLNLVVNLAILSLTRINLKSINIMFLDEVFSFMDESSIRKFIHIISTFFMNKNDLVVYIISHSYGIENAFKPKSTIYIRKQNNKSSIHIQ